MWQADAQQGKYKRHALGVSKRFSLCSCRPFAGRRRLWWPQTVGLLVQAAAQADPGAGPGLLKNKGELGLTREAESDSQAFANGCAKSSTRARSFLTSSQATSQAACLPAKPNAGQQRHQLCSLASGTKVGSLCGAGRPLLAPDQAESQKGLGEGNWGVQQGSLWQSGWIGGLPFQRLSVALKWEQFACHRHPPPRIHSMFILKKTHTQKVILLPHLQPLVSWRPFLITLLLDGGFCCPVRRFECNRIAEPLHRTSLGVRVQNTLGDLAAGSHFQSLLARLSAASLKSKRTLGKEKRLHGCASSLAAPARTHLMSVPSCLKEKLMGPGWPGAGRQAACSPTSSVGAISTARTWRAFSAEAFAGSAVQSEEKPTPAVICQPTSSSRLTGNHPKRPRVSQRRPRGEPSSLLIPRLFKDPCRKCRRRMHQPPRSHFLSALSS